MERPHAQPPSVHELFGFAVHHALHARFCIERGLYWQAEYGISGTRDHALSLACRRRGLPASHGRGFDDLAQEVGASFKGALVRALERDELLHALGSAIEGAIARSR